MTLPACSGKPSLVVGISDFCQAYEREITPDTPKAEVEAVITKAPTVARRIAKNLVSERELCAKPSVPAAQK